MRFAYGALYNWYSIDTAVNGKKNVCPTGWHVPSDNEWTTLTAFLGGESVAGGKMKETGVYYWRSPNTGADNSSEFSGLPGGEKMETSFYYIGLDGFWWSSTSSGPTSAIYRGVSVSNTWIDRESYTSKNYGLSVRCLKD
jgi:uncharacterized protein (TIGR02145 family)